ncbi:(R)-specific enoyl-CoA hydratase [Telopea speciosissima]|uniref:(R)-specific enoyl-CoA hydratase n=1 Tax=Telopea speciosissima TaxID=54955 RepID=UPI001CC61885|nr:(R)-specific enoyl-CoA hydratase [Telopea speciosissima]
MHTRIIAFPNLLTMFQTRERHNRTMLFRRLFWKPIPFLSSSRRPSFSSSTASRVLRIGDVLRQSRRFSDVDVLGYSKLSHDVNPLHFDSESARDAGFEDRLVHGLLVASLFPRIIASHFPGAVYVSQSLHFKLPVYFGDEVVAEVQAVNLRQNQERYIVKFSTKCFKSGNLLVLDGEAMATLPTLAVDE